MTLPAEDPFFPRTERFFGGLVQSEEECPRCGHIARVGIAYAPDVGRHWFQCTNPNCAHEWV